MCRRYCGACQEQADSRKIAGFLPNVSGGQADIAGLERMVAEKIPHVHLEVVEENENQGGKPAKAWCADQYGIPGWKYSTGLLEHCRKPGSRKFHNK